MTGSLADIRIPLKSPIEFVDNFALLVAIVFFYSEFGMHNFHHGISSFPPINGAYILTAYITTRILVQPKLLWQVLNKGLGIWLVLAFIFLLFNYLVTKIMYGKLYESIIDDIASINLTSYVLLFDFMVLLAIPSNLTLVKWLIPPALIFAALNNFYDITLFEDDYGYGYDFRAAGNYLNPNASAQILLMGLLISVNMVKPKFRFLYILVVSGGILLTLSRGAIPILVILLLFFAFNRKFSLASVFIGITTIVVVFMGIWASFQSTKSFDRMVEYLKYNNGIESRINQIVNPSSTKVGIRKTVFEEHYQFYKKSPIVGNGLGSSKYFEMHYSASGHSSHFMYLHMLNEYGLPGLLLLLLLPVSLFYYNFSWHFSWDVLMFALVFIIAGLQSHNLLDAYSMLFSYALLSHLKSEPC